MKNVDGTEPWRGEKHWVSPFNFAPPADRAEALRRPGSVQLHDVTLRDGEQAPGVVFRRDEKVRIARELDAVGLPRIEAGFPVVSTEDMEAVKAIAHLGLGAKVFGFSRLVREDIDAVLACDAPGIVCEGPVGVPKLKQFSWPPEQVADRAVEAISYAKAHGLYTVFFGVDTTRGDWKFLEHVFGRVVREARPDALAVVDTFGGSSPEGFAHLVHRFVETFHLPIEVHTHNDFGLGVATSLAGVFAGASVVHVSVNGLGERTGNAALEEVALALRFLYGVPLDLKYEKFRELSLLVRDLSGFVPAVNKPVVGDRAFTREAGISIAGWAKYHLGSEAYLPEAVGHSHGVVVGKKSGRHSLEYKLQELGLTFPPERLDDLLARVKSAAEAKKSFLTDDEFRRLVQELRA